MPLGRVFRGSDCEAIQEVADLARRRIPGTDYVVTHAGLYQQLDKMTAADLFAAGERRLVEELEASLEVSHG